MKPWRLIAVVVLVVGVSAGCTSGSSHGITRAQVCKQALILDNAFEGFNATDTVNVGVVDGSTAGYQNTERALHEMAGIAKTYGEPLKDEVSKVTLMLISEQLDGEVIAGLPAQPVVLYWADVTNRWCPS
jgi:hypothetical protein